MVAASQVLRGMVAETAEQMPHKSVTTCDGLRETQKVLPSVYTKESLRNEVNTILGQMDMKICSSSSFNRMWHKLFRDVVISKHSSFSKCNTCTTLKEQITAAKTLEEAEVYRQQFSLHMADQRSSRNQYYAHRILSKRDPKKWLCIIQDKMDHNKTSCPRLAQTPKKCSGVMQLPVSLTGKLFTYLLLSHIPRAAALCWPT